MTVAAVLVVVLLASGVNDSSSDERSQRGDPLGGQRTIFEAVKGLCAAVEPRDAPATARALERAGFSVQYTLLADGIPAGGAGSKVVGVPPPGTVVVSVLSPGGAYTGVDPETKQLSVEVAADPGSEPIGRDIGC